MVSNPTRALRNSSDNTSSARLVGRPTTAVMPQPYSSRRRSSCGWSRTSVKPASCSTVQKRLLRLEKLWPALAALAPGFRPQKITSRPLPRISGLYLLKSHRRPPTRCVQWLSRRTATARQLRPSFHGKKVLDLPLDRPVAVVSMARSRPPISEFALVVFQRDPSLTLSIHR